MKILFIDFNLGATVGINNGISILSAVLKEKGNQVKLILLCEETGYGFELDRIKKDIQKFNPDVIGISLMEPQLRYAVDLCNDLSIYYKGFVICGGPYPTMNPRSMLALKSVDAICIGEGEDALLELVEALELGKDYTHVRNLWFKLDGEVIQNKLRSFKDLDKLPPDDKRLFDLNKIIHLKNGQLEMLLGRGCPFKCSYCINGSYLNKYKTLCESSVSMKDYLRIRNIDTVIEEMRSLIVSYPIREIAFVDDNFLVYNNFVDSFTKQYKEKIGLPFTINVNPVTFHVGKMARLKDAGCNTIRFGLESGSERIKREILQRPVSNSTIINAIKESEKLGLTTSTFNMIGLPTETVEEVFDTLRLNAMTKPKFIKVMTFYPFTGTPLYSLCLEIGLINHEKKDILNNYDTFTCLNFPEYYQLFLEKIQKAFNWYINVFLDNEVSPEYQKLISRIESMSRPEWQEFDFDRVDQEASQNYKGITHYSKFMNRSLAVRC